MKAITAFILMVALTLAVALAARNATAASTTVRIPQCEEDEPYLKGKGDFDGERWTRYVCVHIDSIERV